VDQRAAYLEMRHHAHPDLGKWGDPQPPTPPELEAVAATLGNATPSALWDEVRTALASAGYPVPDSTRGIL
jgi:hypothetical protein